MKKRAEEEGARDDEQAFGAPCRRQGAAAAPEKTRTESKRGEGGPRPPIAQMAASQEAARKRGAALSVPTRVKDPIPTRCVRQR